MKILSQMELKVQPWQDFPWKFKEKSRKIGGNFPFLSCNEYLSRIKIKLY